MPQSHAASTANASTDGARDELLGDEPLPVKGANDPLIGKVVSGRFRIVSVIARGGMGKVYKAEQAPLGRVCALKVLSPKYEGDKDPEFHRRFFLEASTASKLSHPNSVTIFDYGTDEDIYYIAMEYIEGRTLFRALRDEGPFPEARAAHITRQICRALREAHGLGVIHRDLKPGNVLLSTHGDEKDYVKVLDFGLVKDVSGDKEDLTQQGLFMGSPKYMAPEQILGGEVSARTDIYALGVMMYEMLCTRVPFDRGAGVGTLMAHVHNEPPPMQSYFPEIVLSATMESIVFRCLEKDPDRRFASMNDLLIALKHIGSEDSLVDAHDSLAGSMLPQRSSIRLTGAPSHPDTTPYPRGTMPRRDSSASGPITGPHGSITGPHGSISGAHGPITGPYTMRSHAGAPSYSGPSDLLMMPATPSNSDIIPGPAPYPDPSFIGMQPPKRRVVPWVIAGAAIVIAGVAVAASQGSSPASDAAADGTNATQPTAAIVAPATPTAAEAPSALAGPTERKVRVESSPPGAAVLENGKAVCGSTPCEVTWKGDEAKAEHKLTVSKGGFKPSVVTVKPSDPTVTVSLEKAAAATKKVLPEGYKDAY
jgi:serine/threonine-protein kinase